MEKKKREKDNNHVCNKMAIKISMYYIPMICVSKNELNACRQPNSTSCLFKLFIYVKKIATVSTIVLAFTRFVSSWPFNRSAFLAAILHPISRTHLTLHQIWHEDPGRAWGLCHHSCGFTDDSHGLCLHASSWAHHCSRVYIANLPCKDLRSHCTVAFFLRQLVKLMVKKIK